MRMKNNNKNGKKNCEKKYEIKMMCEKFFFVGFVMTKMHYDPMELLVASSNMQMQMHEQ